VHRSLSTRASPHASPRNSNSVSTSARASPYASPHACPHASLHGSACQRNSTGPCAGTSDSARAGLSTSASGIANSGADAGVSDGVNYSPTASPKSSPNNRVVPTLILGNGNGASASPHTGAGAVSRGGPTRDVLHVEASSERIQSVLSVVISPIVTKKPTQTSSPSISPRITKISPNGKL
jgi:hypothetical protein